MTLSLVATLVPWAVFLPLGLREGHDPGGLSSGEAIAFLPALAIPVGPSLGYFYAGSTRRGLLGIGIRLTEVEDRRAPGPIWLLGYPPVPPA